VIWADIQTRTDIARAVRMAFPPPDLQDLSPRFMLDRNYLRRKLSCAGTRQDYLDRLDESLRVDAMNEEYPL